MSNHSYWLDALLDPLRPDEKPHTPEGALTHLESRVSYLKDRAKYYNEFPKERYLFIELIEDLESSLQAMREALGE